jgi:hypothetical protein
MSKVCLTVKQQQILSYYQEGFKTNGVFPGTSEAARHFGVNPNSIVSSIGALFLKGAFTDGLPMTNNLRAMHGINAKPMGMTVQTQTKRAATPAQLAALALGRQARIKKLAAARKTKVAKVDSDALIQAAIKKFFQDIASDGLTLNE